VLQTESQAEVKLFAPDHRKNYVMIRSRMVFLVFQSKAKINLLRGMDLMEEACKYS
jgi:hypothetical protein